MDKEYSGKRSKAKYKLYAFLNSNRNLFYIMRKLCLQNCVANEIYFSCSIYFMFFFAANFKCLLYAIRLFVQSIKWWFGLTSTAPQHCTKSDIFEEMWFFVNIFYLFSVSADDERRWQRSQFSAIHIAKSKVWNFGLPTI